MGFQHLWTLAEKTIKKHVANAELAVASEFLVEITEAFDKGHLNEAIVIASGVKNLLKEEALGRYDYETLTRERSRLSWGLLQMLETMSTSSAIYS